jgi:drug/metabolite transporter (DMT)-like permease
MPTPTRKIISSITSLPPLLAGVLAMLCYAGSFIAVRDVAGVVPPAAITFLRSAIAIVILYPLCRKSLHAQWPIIRKHWKFLALQGGLIIVCGNGIMFVGLQFTTAINGSLINSAEPVAIVAVAWLMFRDRLTAMQWAGVLVSLAGVLYLIGRGKLGVLLNLDLNIGDVLVFISIICWAIYAVLMRRVPKELDRLNFLFAILVAGAIASFPFWILENIYYLPTPLTWTTAGVTGGLALFASIFALLWWNRAVEGLGASRAGLLLHLIPVYTVILAVWLLNEEPFLFHAVGIGLIGIGIYLTTILRSGNEKTDG